MISSSFNQSRDFGQNSSNFNKLFTSNSSPNVFNSSFNKNSQQTQNFEKPTPISIVTNSSPNFTPLRTSSRNTYRHNNFNNLNTQSQIQFPAENDGETCDDSQFF